MVVFCLINDIRHGLLEIVVQIFFIFLCGSGWPQTHYVTQTRLKPKAIPLPQFPRVQGLQVSTTTADQFKSLLKVSEGGRK